MTKFLLILTIVYLCLMSGLCVKSNAELRLNLKPEDIEWMQRHVEKVKITHSIEYQAMIERAGGNFADCCSCHKEVCENDSSQFQPVNRKLK